MPVRDLKYRSSRTNGRCRVSRVGVDPELGMEISKPSAAQRCDDETVTFQRAWPPQGSTHHHNGGVLRLLAPREFRHHRCVGRLLAVHANKEITSGTLLQPIFVATHPSWRAQLPLNSGLGGVRGVAAATAVGTFKASPLVVAGRRRSPWRVASQNQVPHYASRPVQIRG
jgi:hypothetical protein